MKIPKIPFSVKDLDTVIRAVPVIRDLFPDTKAGFNSLIDEPAYNSQLKKLEDALHDKKAEICKLREKLKEVEAIVEEYRDALLKKEIYSGKPFK